ncbi:MAG: hypothetical protein GEV11_16215 [Streptosporangiales bacterium]|nr:hypothetical protein [Streptosporangiales bacterium]
MRREEVARLAGMSVDYYVRLLAGALPVIAVLRRRPPRIPDRVHAWAYIGLLTVVVIAMLPLG